MNTENNLPESCMNDCLYPNCNCERLSKPIYTDLKPTNLVETAVNMIKPEKKSYTVEEFREKIDHWKELEGQGLDTKLKTWDQNPEPVKRETVDVIKIIEEVFDNTIEAEGWLDNGTPMASIVGKSDFLAILKNKLSTPTPEPEK